MSSPKSLSQSVCRWWNSLPIFLHPTHTPIKPRHLERVSEDRAFISALTRQIAWQITSLWCMYVPLKVVTPRRLEPDANEPKLWRRPHLDSVQVLHKPSNIDQVLVQGPTWDHCINNMSVIIKLHDLAKKKSQSIWWAAPVSNLFLWVICHFYLDAF